MGGIHERYQTEEGASAYARKYDRSFLRRWSLGRELACVARAVAAAQAASGGGGGILLDLPCGAGRFAGIFSGAAEVYAAADFSLPMVKLCRAAAGPGTLAFLADAGRIPLADRAVDGVGAIRLIHHFPDPAAWRALVAEFARVADRYVVLSFLDRGSLKHRLKAMKERLTGRGSRRAAVRRREIEEAFAQRGFRVVAFFALSSLFSGQTVAAAVREDAR